MLNQPILRIPRLLMASLISAGILICFVGIYLYTSRSAAKASAAAAAVKHEAVVRRTLEARYRHMGEMLRRKDAAAYFAVHAPEYQELVLWGTRADEGNDPRSSVVKRANLAAMLANGFQDTERINRAEFVIRSLRVHGDEAVATVEQHLDGYYFEQRMPLIDHPSTWESNGKSYRGVSQKPLCHWWRLRSGGWMLTYGEQLDYATPKAEDKVYTSSSRS